MHCKDGCGDLEVVLGQVNCTFQGQCTFIKKNDSCTNTFCVPISSVNT